MLGRMVLALRSSSMRVGSQQRETHGLYVIQEEDSGVEKGFGHLGGKNMLR